MSESRREVGFIRALGQSRVSQLIWPEGILAAVIGLGGGVLLLKSTEPADQVRVVGVASQFSESSSAWSSLRSP